MTRLRKIKLIALVLSLTSCLIMFSVGFSAWFKLNAPAPMTPDTPGTFEAYDVEQMSDYVKPRKNGFTMFEFTALGFREGKNQISATYDLVADKLTSYANGGLSISSTLSYSNLIDYNDGKKLFDFTGKNEVTVLISYKVGDKIKTATPQVSNNKTDITVTYTFEKELPSEFTVIYTFEVKDGFRNNFGKYISVKDDKKTQFHTSVRITNLAD